jgi:membrane protein required for colicin V production
MTFTIFDIIILTVLSASSFLGLYRGMISITINLLGFVASIFAAIYLYSYVRIIFSGYVENELVTSIVSGIASYIASLIVFTFLSSKIVLLFKSVSLGIFDRLLGFIIGLVRGGFISILIFLVVAVFTAGTYSGVEKPEEMITKLEMEKYPKWLKTSMTAPHLEKVLKAVFAYIPQDMLDSIEMPKDNSKTDEDIIDIIKRKKEGEVKPSEVKSSTEIPLDKALTNSINEVLEDDEE